MNRLHKKTIVQTIGREPVHPFPARMAAGIAFDVISKAKGPLRVLDPMSGSGTVLAVARSKGHQAIGIDLDPLAVLIAKVWTTAVDQSAVRIKAVQALTRARKIFKTLAVRDAYPAGADDQTRAFVAYWFDPYSRRQLTSLAVAINGIHDKTIREVLWCGFSRLIITKQSGASLAMDLSHSRPHKAFKQAPIKPFNKFLSAVGRVVENCIGTAARRRGPACRVIEGDARDLPLPANSIDMVLTSPPYLNAIDYMRCSKFSLVWMGYRIDEIRSVRADSVGAEVARRTASEDEISKSVIAELKLMPKLSTHHEAILARYINDMHRALKEVDRVLRPGGTAVYVIGENTVRGTYIRNSGIICSIAKTLGLNLKERRTRKLPANRRYLPPPGPRSETAALDSRMRREVVLRFHKPQHAVPIRSVSSR